MNLFLLFIVISSVLYSDVRFVNANLHSCFIYINTLEIITVTTLVSVIASSDLYKEPTRPDHQNSFLEVEHPRPRHLRNCNETFAINILRTIMTLWLYEYQIVRMKARTVSQWEGSIVTFRPIRGVLESENEGAQGERPLPGRSEVQEDQRPGRKLSQKN